MTLLPTVEVSQVCTTPSPAEKQEQRDHEQRRAGMSSGMSGAAAVDGEQRVVEDALHDERRDDGDRRAGDDEEAR